MIQQVDIEEFRGIRDCDDPLDISDFTILVGRNNSGKTAFLEAIYLCQNGSDILTGYTTHDFVQQLHSGKNLAYRYSGNGVISLDGNIHGEIEVSGNVSSQNGSFPDNIFYFPSTDQYLNRMYSRLQGQRDEIEKSSAHIRVAEFLNQCIEDTYTEIYLETLEARKKPKDEQQFWVDIDDLGNGLVQTIPIFLALEAYDPEIIVWDDMGTALHPSLLREVIQYISKQDVQVIAATHSIDVLSTILDVRPEESSILQLSKTDDDILHHTKMTLDDLELMMENAGHDPRYLADELKI